MSRAAAVLLAGVVLLWPGAQAWAAACDLDSNPPAFIRMT